MIKETAREKKDRLHRTFRQLESLNYRVSDAIKRGKPLTEPDWNALVSLAQSEDINVQMRVLEEAIEFTEEELIEVWVPLARDRYHDFYEFMNRDEGYIMSPHQNLIGDLLMASEAKEIMRFMLSMPPGHCKSTHSSHHFPAWYFGRNPKQKFLQAGHSQDFVSKELGARVRGIIESEDFQRVFPDIRLRSDMRAMDYWGLTNMKGKYVAKGAGQGISGFRGNYGMVDDPYKSRKDAESPTIRETVFKWYADDFSTRLLPGSPLGIIMTRWHSDDICGRITDRESREKTEEQEALKEKLELSGELENLQEKQLIEKLEELGPQSKKYRFEIINLPAICEDDDDILGRTIGEPLWPELFDLDALENLRSDMTPASWNSLYQGTPIDVEGGAVSSEWFQRYDKAPSKTDESTSGQVKRITVSVDAANTAKERSDFTVILAWAEDHNKNHYLLDVSRKQMEFPVMSAEIARMCRRWKADALLIEMKGNGLSYYQLKKDGGAPAPMIPIEVSGHQSKEFRFDQVTPMFEAGQVYLPERASWLPDYEKEIVSFPLGKHDDQVDATSQYLKWARKRGRRGTKKLGGTGHAR
jgi:predicted phage terminase large subunit-like protein